MLWQFTATRWPLLSLPVNKMAAERFLHNQVPPPLSPPTPLMMLATFQADYIEVTCQISQLLDCIIYIIWYSNLMPICCCVQLNCNIVSQERDISPRCGWQIELYWALTSQIQETTNPAAALLPFDRNCFLSLWFSSLFVHVWPQVYFRAMTKCYFSVKLCL